MNGGGNGTPNHRTDFVAWNKGKTGCYTEEARRRMSEGRRGIPVSDETRRRISEAQKGRRHSDESKRRMSENRRGIPVSEETRKRISIALKGKTLSEETRKRISIAHKGKPLSEETRKRLSIVNKGKGVKPVLMFNRNGDFVAEFPSITAAAEYLSVSTPQVAAVLNGTHKFAGGGRGNKNAGYTFKYKNENPDR